MSLTYERLIVNYIAGEMGRWADIIKTQRNRLRIFLRFKKMNENFLNDGCCNAVPYSNFDVEQHF